MRDSQIDFERCEFFQRIRSAAFRMIALRSMNQWRILMGIRRGKLDKQTYQYLERVQGYYGDTDDGLMECFYHGIKPPEHADDIRDWIHDAMTFDELDTWRFRLNNYQYLRAA